MSEDLSFPTAASFPEGPHVRSGFMRRCLFMYAALVDEAYAFEAAFASGGMELTIEGCGGGGTLPGARDGWHHCNHCWAPLQGGGLRRQRGSSVYDNQPPLCVWDAATVSNTHTGASCRPA